MISLIIVKHVYFLIILIKTTVTTVTIKGNDRSKKRT